MVSLMFNSPGISTSFISWFALVSYSGLPGSTGKHRLNIERVLMRLPNRT